VFCRINTAGDHGVGRHFSGGLRPLRLCRLYPPSVHGAALIAAGVYNTARARWRMVFTERFDQTGASVAVLTSKINQVIEQQSAARPKTGSGCTIVGKRLSRIFLLGALQTRHYICRRKFRLVI